MFVSKDDLKLQYGVDMEIGKFFVDRKVPKDNSYWSKRLLYIVPMPGNLFIPIFTDLEFRLGLDKRELLSEGHVTLLEHIMDSAGRHEAKQISDEQHIAECIALAEAECKNPSLLQDLKYYFSGEKEKASIPLGYPFKSLQRADAYLFSLCYFEFDQTLKKKLTECWNALMSFYLIVDDLDDIKADFANHEENSIIESGLEKGINTIRELIDRSYEIIQPVNPVLANRFDHKRSVIDIKKIIESFLNDNRASSQT